MKLWHVLKTSSLIFLLTMTMVIALAQTAVIEDMPNRTELEEGWNTLYPGGDTICSYGTEYSFHVYPADSADVMIFFNGGGACWFSQSCSPASPTFIPFADLDHNVPTARSGIFDFDNPENPFVNYNIIFVPYCTGDVHLGNNVMTYELPGTASEETQEFTLFHNGYNNSMAVLNWVVDNFDSPESLFVAGSSAGSIAVPFYTGLLAESYPDTRIVALGDGSGGYRAPQGTALVNTTWNTVSILPDWEEYADADEENLNFESYYIRTAQRFPNIMFAQYNTAEDETQYSFLAILGIRDISLKELIMANYNDIRADVDNFVTYTAGGTLHTILRLPELYTYKVEDVRLLDWLVDLVNGRSVMDVMCVDCDNAPGED